MSSLTQRKLRPVTHSPDAFTSSGGPSPYLAGEVIGDRYRLDREIGRGGMGVVWVAHSLVLGVDVALKLIHAETAGASLATRMSREAYAAARLGHPALVRVFDFGWTNRGDPFLVMEFVQGETLASKVRRDGPIAAIRAVQTLLPIADGLRLAHERGIVHRDIKPDNILLATDALGRVQPKLLDFGIAKVEQAPVDGKLTQMGAVLGSPEYMSPEQAQGLDEVDGRTDVWSLSIALYELLTGDVPFVGSNYNALMQAIINDPAPPPRAGDSELWSVLTKGLAKSPDDRWSSMSEFGEALARWLYDHGVKEDLSGNSVRAVWLERPTGPWTAITNAEPVQRRSSRPFAETQERLKVVKPWQKPKVRWALGVAVVAAAVFAVLELGFSDGHADSVVSVSEPLPESVHARTVLEQAPAPDELPVKQIDPSPSPSAQVSAPPSAAEPPATKRNNSRVQPKPKKPRHDFGF